MYLDIRFVAKTNEDLAKGLMYSKPLLNNECAFFIFKHLDDHSFWNKNVDFPISLLFLDENFQIKDIGKLEAHQEKPCRSGYPMIKYVLEGHVDLPVENDIKVNDYCLPGNDKIKIIKGKRKVN
jgi:uncharacterized membrane protein (UPF0127 family)